MRRLSIGLVIFSIISYNGLFCVSAKDTAAAKNVSDEAISHERDNLGEVLRVRGLEFTSEELGNPFSSAHEMRTEKIEEMYRATHSNHLISKDAAKPKFGERSAAIDAAVRTNLPRYVGTIGRAGESLSAIIAFGERDYFVTVGERLNVTLGKSDTVYEVLSIEEESISLLSPAGEIELTRERL